MAASINDLLTNITSSGSARAATALLDTPGKAIAAPSINITVNTNWATDSAVHVAIYSKTAEGKKDVATQTDWKGVLSGSTISSLTLRGGTDRAYVSGAIVEITPTQGWARDLYLWGTTFADTLGVLKAGIVGATQLASNAVTTAKIALNAVTADKLATDAITLGYAQIVANFVTTSLTPVQATGLTIAVTVPTGGRKIKITAFTGFLYLSNTGNVATLSIWDGVVGVGTQISNAQSYGANINVGAPVTCVAIVTPAAGTKTYNVGLQASGNSSGIQASSTSPAFILVEAI